MIDYKDFRSHSIQNDFWHAFNWNPNEPKEEKKTLAHFPKANHIVAESASRAIFEAQFFLFVCDLFPIRDAKFTSKALFAHCSADLVLAEPIVWPTNATKKKNKTAQMQSEPHQGIVKITYYRLERHTKPLKKRQTKKKTK